MFISVVRNGFQQQGNNKIIVLRIRIIVVSVFLYIIKLIRIYLYMLNSSQRQTKIQFVIRGYNIYDVITMLYKTSRRLLEYENTVLRKLSVSDTYDIYMRYI